MRKGFTLVEMLLVIAIIVILFSLIAPQFGPLTAQAEIATVEQSLSQELSDQKIKSQSGYSENPTTTDTTYNIYGIEISTSETIGIRSIKGKIQPPNTHPIDIENEKRGNILAIDTFDNSNESIPLSIVKNLQIGGTASQNILLFFPPLSNDVLLYQGSRTSPIQIPRGDIEFDVSHARYPEIKRHISFDPTTLLFRK